MDKGTALAFMVVFAFKAALPLRVPLDGAMPLRKRVYERGSIGAALRPFKGLLEKSDLQKELRKRSHAVPPFFADS